MKNKKNITDSIMDKIVEEKIVPKARWEFLLKNYLVWFVGVIAALVGGVATSGVIFVFRNSDWVMYRRLSGSFFDHTLTFMPLLWLILLAGFVYLAICQMKHTKRGYKYPIVLLVAVNIFVSGVLGVTLYGVGYAHVLDTQAGRVLPLYKAVEERREELWVQPERGLLAGIVLGTTTDAFLLQDYLGDKWEVSRELLGQIDDLVLLHVDEVGIVGNKTGTSSFEACAVRPWDMAGEYPKLREERKQNRLENTGYRNNLPMIEKLPPPQIIRGPMREDLSLGRRSGKDILQTQLRQKGFGEGRLQDLREIVCERATTTSQ
ncbi:MAG: hypothetical protein KAS07_04165 [Candidatus Pacebacteria bacterium]|nr:hypothetical protein [Candidatus Paceibacterota bacterium]